MSYTKQFPHVLRSKYVGESYGGVTVTEVRSKSPNATGGDDRIAIVIYRGNTRAIAYDRIAYARKCATGREAASYLIDVFKNQGQDLNSDIIIAAGTPAGGTVRSAKFAKLFKPSKIDAAVAGKKEAIMVISTSDPLREELERRGYKTVVDHVGPTSRSTMFEKAVDLKVHPVLMEDLEGVPNFNKLRGEPVDINGFARLNQPVMPTNVGDHIEVMTKLINRMNNDPTFRSIWDALATATLKPKQ